MPDAAEFAELGRRAAKCKQSRSAKVALCRFKSHFGTPPDVVSDAWELIVESPFVRDSNMLGHKEPDPAHFLWGLMLLKLHSTWDVLANALSVDVNTVKKWGMLYLEACAELDCEVVSSEHICVAN